VACLTRRPHRFDAPNGVSVAGLRVRAIPYNLHFNIANLRSGAHFLTDLTVMTRLVIALSISCLFTWSAGAADVRIGEMTIALPSLPGHCEMDVVHASDAPLIAKLHASVQKTGQRLLLLSANCKELKEWREGKRPALTHMAEYQTVLAFEHAR